MKCQSAYRADPILEQGWRYNIILCCPPNARALPLNIPKDPTKPTASQVSGQSSWHQPPAICFRHITARG
eukprot:543865-Hanusia_phi.AAC.1